MTTAGIYRRGRAFEYRVASYYRKGGWVVIRSAGSHSPIDLVCARGGEIQVVQCKDGDGYLQPLELATLKSVAAEFGARAFKAYKDPHGHNKFVEV